MTRARGAFWLLSVIAVIAVGTLSRAVTVQLRTATGLTVELSATVLVTALVRAARILVRLDRHTRRDRS